MNYTTARSKIRSGDLLAWSHRGWGSWYDLQVMAVRIFTQSEYCHVGVAMRVGGRVLVHEAVGAGVRVFPLSRMAPFYHLPLGLDWNAAAEAFVWKTLGQGYSKLQAIEAHLGRLHAATDDLWQCAELSQELIEQLGCKLECKPTPTRLVYAAQEQRGALLRLITQ
jgi:hypothetical protein